MVFIKEGKRMDPSPSPSFPQPSIKTRELAFLSLHFLFSKQCEFKEIMVFLVSVRGFTLSVCLDRNIEAKGKIQLLFRVEKNLLYKNVSPLSGICSKKLKISKFLQNLHSMIKQYYELKETLKETLKEDED
ncbi:uncharacterized protein [Spinacia oleracea]|uniref:Uncharacterized protein isoform X2 n=1 Tax=Spinacia oleracea TaxID=3562 RepID=A0ABM3R0J0_SPIOL|nr:uncharacterized protein LOC130463886 isoform X2 [Spinacia oleracea]